MTVSHEIKSQLAKLLATEDLVVEHKKVETAQFNVHTRVLTLPMWEKASNVVYDMLVGHEVGHALYTPDRNWLKEYNIPPQFVNIVEDARIEKLMKRRYMGLAKTFYGGYKELAEQYFFQVADEDINLMNLADRANLWFKIGNYTQIPIESGEEKEIIDAIADTETFDDVLVVSEKLYKYCKEKKKTESQTDQHQENQQEGQSEETSMQSSQNESDDDQPNNESSDAPVSGGGQNETSDVDASAEEPEVKTADSLEESLKDLIDHMHGSETTYVQIPDLDISEVIIPNSEIHKSCEEYWIDVNENNSTTLNFPDQKYAEFKKSAQKEVNYLVKEFECRKSADAYARATTARTGVLDCSKLHTYRYNEDLFRKVTTLADGKNHGLIFVLDWSGSMQYVMEDTIKQLFNLIWFCKKVNIPFEVYAFTGDYPYVKPDDNGILQVRPIPYKKEAGYLAIPEWFSLMNILTSKVNAKTLEQQMKSIYRIAYSFRNYCGYGAPHGMSLSGTPLNESLVALHKIIPQFKKEHKLQKVQCVILTDGEANPLKYHKEFNRKFEDGPYIGTIYAGEEFVLRDRKTGNTYNVTNDYVGFTTKLLENLRDNFVVVNFIGIRIISGRDANSFIRLHCKNYEERDKNMKTWRKEKSFVIRNAGYHSYFALSSNALSNDSEFEVNEDATKAQIKTAFVKSLRVKKMNKKILGEFVELIA